MTDDIINFYKYVSNKHKIKFPDFFLMQFSNLNYWNDLRWFPKECGKI